MSQTKSFLLALKGNDNRKIVLEFESEHYLSGKLNAANELGLWVRILSSEEMQSEEFKDVQIYDMKHEATSKIFYLEQWQNYLMPQDTELLHTV
jgi:hypothetical protein